MKKLHIWLLLVLTAVLLFPGQAFAANKNTSFTLKGEPVYKPALGKDGNLRVLYSDAPYADYPNRAFTFAVTTPGGQQLSSWQDKGLPYFAADAKGNERVYNLDSRFKLNAYDLKHRKLWEAQLGKHDSIEKIDLKGNVYVQRSDAKSVVLTKVNAANGRKINYPKTQHESTQVSENGTYAYQIAKGKDGRQSVLRNVKTNGKIAWTKSPFDKTYKKTKSKLESVHIHFVDEKGTAYVAVTYANGYIELHAYNNKGKRLWKRDIGKYWANQFGVSGNTLYYESGFNKAAFVDRNTGKIIKSLKLDTSEDAFKLISNAKNIYLTGHGKLYSYTNKGKRVGVYTYPKTDGYHRLYDHAFDGKGRLYAVLYNKDADEKYPFSTTVVIDETGKVLKETHSFKNFTRNVVAHPTSGAYYVFSETGSETNAVTSVSSYSVGK